MEIALIDRREREGGGGSDKKENKTNYVLVPRKVIETRK